MSREKVGFIGLVLNNANPSLAKLKKDIFSLMVPRDTIPVTVFMRIIHKINTLDRSSVKVNNGTMQ
jgi:hypothetical protein